MYIYIYIYYYTKKSYILSSFSRNVVSPLERFIETSTFYHICTIFNLECWRVKDKVCNNSNKYHLRNKSAKKMFLHKAT